MLSGPAFSCPVFGVAATIRVSGEQSGDAAIEAVRRRWVALERRFDPSSPDSELSMVVSGRSSVQRASAEFRALHAEVMRWRIETGGHSKPDRPAGALDLGALVRASAVRDAGVELAKCGVHSWMVELGDDLMSDALGSGGWSATIPDPADAEQLLATIPLGGSWTAVATERTPEQATNAEFAQVTVLGRDIVTVRALAAAVAVGGAAAVAFAVDRWPVEVLTVDRSGNLRSTPRLERLVQRGGVARRPLPKLVSGP